MEKYLNVYYNNNNNNVYSWVHGTTIICCNDFVLTALATIVQGEKNQKERVSSTVFNNNHFQVGIRLCSVCKSSFFSIIIKY